MTPLIQDELNVRKAFSFPWNPPRSATEPTSFEHLFTLERRTPDITPLNVHLPHSFHQAQQDRQEQASTLQ